VLRGNYDLAATMSNRIWVASSWRPGHQEQRLRLRGPLQVAGEGAQEGGVIEGTLTGRRPGHGDVKFPLFHPAVTRHVRSVAYVTVRDWYARPAAGREPVRRPGP
jgi:hypothetical protein